MFETVLSKNAKKSLAVLEVKEISREIFYSQ